jgi:DNA-binding transcriptional LysR family regulator
MQVFLAIARRGSFGEGAEDVGVSRAMASKHVKALETELGVRLLNRTTRSISLTEAGEIYLEQIGPLLEQLETVEERVTKQSAEPKGNLAVAAPTSFGIFHLAPIIAGYMDKYPDVKVHLTLTDRDVNLVDEGFDVAVFIRELEDSSYVARLLGAARMMICAAPEYLRTHG